jgi:uncharacterized membrane protein
MPIITDPLAITAVLFAAIFFSVQMVRRYPWAARLSTIIWVIFTSALLSNVGLIPTDAPIYGDLIGFTVPFAVCIILFTVSLKDVRDAGSAMLAAFALATIGTVIGVVVATLSTEPLLASILGDDVWKLAGPYTGTYIGGSLNFLALWTGLEIGNPDLFAAANAVDNLTLFPLYALWVVIPGILGGRYIVARKWRVASDDHAVKAVDDKTPFKPVDVVTLVFLALLVMVASDWFKSAVVDQILPGVPAILIVTTLALSLGQVPAIRGLKGGWEIGDLAFWVFFASIGALIDFYLAVVLSPALFLYVIIIMAVHFVVLFGVGWLMKMDVGVLIIASVATKSGPAVVPPVAETLGLRHLVLPGIILGMLGYAVGNYVGFVVAQVVRTMLVG